MNDIKTYLHDTSENLRQILSEAEFVHFNDSGKVMLEGGFTAEDLEKIITVQAEVIARLATMRQELSASQ